MYATSFIKLKPTGSVGDPWCGYGSADPYLWLTEPDLTSDPTPLFSDFKDAKKLFFLCNFFLITYPQAYYLQSYKIFAEILCKNFILQALFQSAQHLYEKREGSRSLTNGSGRPKNMRIRIPNTAHRYHNCSLRKAILGTRTSQKSLRTKVGFFLFC